MSLFLTSVLLSTSPQSEEWMGGPLPAPGAQGIGSQGWSHPQVENPRNTAATSTGPGAADSAFTLTRAPPCGSRVSNVYDLNTLYFFLF